MRGCGCGTNGRVRPAARRTYRGVGTPVGLHVQSVEDVERRVKEGWQFIALGSELKFMVTEANRLVQGMNLQESRADLARY